jgi:hypothetical protein
MATKAVKALKRAENEGLLIVCQVDENYSSRVCNLCQQQSNEQKEVLDEFSGQMVSLWGVLQCSICHYNWDRDHNASTNILNLGLLECAGIDRPDVFSRSMPYEPPPSPTNDHGDENMLGDDDDNHQMEVDTDAVTPSQEMNLGFLNLNL